MIKKLIFQKNPGILRHLFGWLNPALSVLILLTAMQPHLEVSAQVKPEAGDPANRTDIPEFFRSRLSDIDAGIHDLKKGKDVIIATSPGGLPVYAVYYGQKDDMHTQANYNSAVGAGNPAFYADKNETTKPVIFFLGPVHGQEVEGIAGLLNLIHVLETGSDFRGKDWSALQRKLDQCRVIIVPCANPDGRQRCPYDSFLGLPTAIMTKYGQGTRKDGSSWGWPLAKSVHPMKGDVGILGSYFNDNGVNIMHDDFFAPMAEETEALMNIARSEAPDMTVCLHSHENRSIILQPAYVPFFMKERVHELALQLNNRFKALGLPNYAPKEIWEPSIDDKNFPPHNSFNLVSALNQVSGTMSFTFECSHGSVNENISTPVISFDSIIDMQMSMYEEMVDYLLRQRLYQTKK